MSARVALLATGLLVLAASAGISRLSDPVAQLPALLAWCALATAGWLLGALAARRVSGSRENRVGWVICVALATRLLVLVPSVPLSDDLYRYLWDGRVGNAGTNPYLYPPGAAELSALRDASIWPRINHPSLPTLYPPVAQLYFRALDGVTRSALGPRVVAVAMDVVTTLLLALLLRRRQRPASLALVYGWCPLAILESGGGGHVDAVGVALLVAGFLALTSASRRRALLGGFLLAASALVKPAALLLAPAVLVSRGARRAWILAGAAIALLTFIPYLDAGPRLFAGFRTYAENWHFNDALFSRLVAAGAAPIQARRILGVTLLAVVLLVAWRVRDALRASAVILGAFLALSPTVHPWYGLWLLPFLPFAPTALVPAGLALCALLPVSYVTPWQRYATGVWSEPAWVRSLLWGVVAAALLLTFARVRVRGWTSVRGPLTAARGTDR